MEVKLFEIRDEGTCISALAIKLGGRNEAERWLLSRAGYGKSPTEQEHYVLLMNTDGAENRVVNYDPFAWKGPRTMQVAHQYIEKNFDTLPSGSVVCVEFLSGERDTPKVTDAQTVLV